MTLQGTRRQRPSGSSVRSRAISTSDLVDRLADAIMGMIGSSEIPAGAHLSTPKLAERFDVSRSPVREALQPLADRDVLTKEAHRGFFVSSVRPDVPSRAGSAAHDEPAGYRRIADDRLSDAIPAEVTEHLLRERYGLSTAQLSKILALGKAEGWFERKGGYGWRLLPVAKTPESLKQIYRVRLIIEPAALLEPSFACDREILEIHRMRQRRPLDHDTETAAPSTLVALGAQFHEDVIKMSGNSFLHQTLIRLNRVRRLIDLRFAADRNRFYSQCKEHLDLIDLLASGANVEAARLMHDHLQGAVSAKVASNEVRWGACPRSRKRDHT